MQVLSSFKNGLTVSWQQICANVIIGDTATPLTCFYSRYLVKYLACILCHLFSSFCTVSQQIRIN